MDAMGKEIPTNADINQLNDSTLREVASEWLLNVRSNSHADRLRTRLITHLVDVRLRRVKEAKQKAQQELHGATFRALRHAVTGARLVFGQLHDEHPLTLFAWGAIWNLETAVRHGKELREKALRAAADVTKDVDRETDWGMRVLGELSVEIKVNRNSVRELLMTATDVICTYHSEFAAVIRTTFTDAADAPDAS